MPARPAAREVRRPAAMRIADEPSTENAPGTHRSPDHPLFEAPRNRTREPGERLTTWLELFFDLVFVVAVDQVARRLKGDARLADALGYLVLYVPIWWAWVGHAVYTDRFGTDDLTDRLLTLVQMGAVLVLAVLANEALEGRSAAFALAYGAFRLVLALRYALAARGDPQTRPESSRQAAGFAIAAAAWLGSALVPPPWRYWLWGAGFLVDLGTPLTIRRLHRVAPPDPVHMEERFGTFVNIVLGVGFVALVDGPRPLGWSVTTATNAALVLVGGFALWWIYFEALDTAPMKQVAEANRTGPYMVWAYGHLPFVAGLSAAGIVVADVVRQSARPALADVQRQLHGGAIALAFAGLALLQLAYASAGGGGSRRRLALWNALAALGALGVAAFGRGLSSTAVLAMVLLPAAALVAPDLVHRPRAPDRAGTGEEARPAGA